MGSARQHAMERRQKPKGKARTLGGPLLGPDDRPIPRRRPTGTPALKGMSPPRRKSNPNAEASAKARAAYAAMIKSRAEALKKRKQRPTGKPVPQAKDSLASIAARKQFIDRLKRQTAIYNKLKTTKTPAKPKQKGINRFGVPIAKPKGYSPPKSLGNLADLLKKTIPTGTYNPKKPEASDNKKIPKGISKKVLGTILGRGKKPTSKRTFVRT